jgi:DNA mismatch repair protein MutH
VINYVVYLVGYDKFEKITYKGGKSFQIDPKAAAAMKLTPDEVAREKARIIASNMETNGKIFRIRKLMREINMM